LRCAQMQMRGVEDVGKFDKLELADSGTQNLRAE
jgi:hypothetical protein